MGHILSSNVQPSSGESSTPGTKSPAASNASQPPYNLPSSSVSLSASESETVKKMFRILSDGLRKFYIERYGKEPPPMSKEETPKFTVSFTNNVEPAGKENPCSLLQPLASACGDTTGESQEGLPIKHLLGTCNDKQIWITGAEIQKVEQVPSTTCETTHYTKICFRDGTSMVCKVHAGSSQGEVEIDFVAKNNKRGLGHSCRGRRGGSKSGSEGSNSCCKCRGRGGRSSGQRSKSNDRKTPESKNTSLYKSCNTSPVAPTKSKSKSPSRRKTRCSKSPEKGGPASNLRSRKKNDPPKDDLWKWDPNALFPQDHPKPGSSSTKKTKRKSKSPKCKSSRQSRSSCKADSRYRSSSRDEE